MPNTTMYDADSVRLVPTSSWDSSNDPMARASPPSTENGRYRVGLFMARPLKIDVTNCPTRTGSSSRPLLVAEARWTFCWYSGRNVIAPYIATPTRKPSTRLAAKSRTPNRRGGRIGSLARRSTTTIAANPTTATTASVRSCGDVQAYRVPPQTETRMATVVTTVSNAAPRKSMRCSIRVCGSRSFVATSASATRPMGRLM